MNEDVEIERALTERWLSTQPRQPRKRTGAPVTWYRERIIESVHAWALKHGHPPSAKDWRLAEPPHHPSYITVIGRFGSWDSALEASGFSGKRPTRPPSELRDRRERLGLSRVQLCVMADCSMGYLQMLEMGAVPKRRSEVLPRIRAVLDAQEKEVA